MIEVKTLKSSSTGERSRVLRVKRMEVNHYLKYGEKVEASVSSFEINGGVNHLCYLQVFSIQREQPRQW